MILTEPTIRWASPRHIDAGSPVEPGALSAGSVRLEVTSVGLCGTDLSVWSGANDRATSGTVLGHEFGGRIVKIGDDVTGVRVGDLVAVDPNLSCGLCVHCADGRRALCPDRLLMGVDVDGGLRPIVDVDAGQLVAALGADPRALGLVEPLAVGIHAVARAGVDMDARVGVVGGGPIGMAAVVEAHRRGATCTVLEADPTRREAITAAGLAESIQRPWAPRTLDVVIDTVARESTVQLALDAVRDGGLVCLVGLSHDEHLPAPEQLVRREVTLTGSFCYRSADLHTAAAIVADRGIDAIPVELVDGLDAVPDMLARHAEGRLGRGKALIIPRTTVRIP